MIVLVKFQDRIDTAKAGMGQLYSELVLLLVPLAVVAISNWCPRDEVTFVFVYLFFYLNYLSSVFLSL